MTRLILALVLAGALPSLAAAQTVPCPEMQEHAERIMSIHQQGLDVLESVAAATALAPDDPLNPLHRALAEWVAGTEVHEDAEAQQEAVTEFGALALAACLSTPEAAP